MIWFQYLARGKPYSHCGTWSTRRSSAYWRSQPRTSLSLSLCTQQQTQNNYNVIQVLTFRTGNLESGGSIAATINGDVVVNSHDMVHRLLGNIDRIGGVEGAVSVDLKTECGPQFWREKKWDRYQKLKKKKRDGDRGVRRACMAQLLPATKPSSFATRLVRWYSSTANSSGGFQWFYNGFIAFWYE